MKALQERWWKAPEKRVHEALFSAVQDMETDQVTRRTDNAILRELFRAKGYRATIHGDAAPNLSPAYADGVWRYNLIRTAVDVLSAKVGRGKPKASFVTTGGTWAEQRQAKRLDKYVFGVMHATDFYREARKVFRDAAVTDIGVVKGWVSDGKVCISRVDPDEIKVSMADAYYGKPQTLVHSYCVSRDMAHAWVEAWHDGAKKEERERMHHLVDNAEVAHDKDRALRRTATFGDVIQVEEAWHLPARDGSGGRHVLAISNLTLVDDKDEAAPNFFPFAFCRIYEPFLGFYGQGVGELLVPHQRAINATLRRISAIITNMSKGRIYADNGTKIRLEQLAGMQDTQIIYGARPGGGGENHVPSELWRWADYAIQRGLEQVGINEGAVAARKPAGLESGQALRDYEDIQSERHAVIHLAFEDFILDAARLVVRLSRRAADDGERLTAFFPKGRRSEPIDWTDVQADEDSFTLQVFSTSSLPVSPTARKQYVEELWSSGQIDSAEYRRLLEIPDTDASTDLALAARDVVDAALERMLDGDGDTGAEDDYTPPEPFDDLAYAMKRGTIAYARARLEGAPEARLDLVRRYILQAQGLMALAQAAQAPQGDMRQPDAAQPSPLAAA
jgi:hypothetical protein